MNKTQTTPDQVLNIKFIVDAANKYGDGRTTRIISGSSSVMLIWVKTHFETILKKPIEILLTTNIEEDNKEQIVLNIVDSVTKRTLMCFGNRSNSTIEPVFDLVGAIDTGKPIKPESFDDDAGRMVYPKDKTDTPPSDFFI